MIDPGEGYRLLVDGEKIHATDEVWSFGVGHWEVKESDLPLLNEHWNNREYWPMRRKIPGKPIHFYTTCDDLGTIHGAVVYATERDISSENVREIKVDPSTGTLYVEGGHGRPSGEA